VANIVTGLHPSHGYFSVTNNQLTTCHHPTRLEGFCWLESQPPTSTHNATHSIALRRAPEPIIENSEPNTTTPTPPLYHCVSHVELGPQESRPSRIGSTTRRFLPAAPRGVKSWPGGRCALRRAGTSRQGLVGVTAVQGHQAPILCGRCRQQAWGTSAVISQLLDGTEAVQPP
jgi:hypothetical protein